MSSFKSKEKLLCAGDELKKPKEKIKREHLDENGKASKRTKVDDKKEETKASIPTVTSDKKQDDNSASSVQRGNKMSLGIIYKIENYITNTKVVILQVLHTVSFFCVSNR